MQGYYGTDSGAVCHKSLYILLRHSLNEPGWHNWLARETFNLKVEGSSPSSGEINRLVFSSFFLYFLFCIRIEGCV